MAFGFLSYGGIDRSGVMVLIGAGLLAAAAIAFQAMMRRHDRLRRARRRIAYGLILAGVALGAVWLVFKPGGGVGLSGICALYLGFGQLLAEWRAGQKAPRYGLAVCAASAAAFVLGLALAVWVHAFGLALSAIALLLAPVGLTLLSEDVMRRRRLRSWLALPAGLLAALAGVLLLEHWTGLPPHLAWPLAAALFVLVGAIASSTQADVLIVVTVVALAWTAIPEGVKGGDATRADGRPTLVSLGDSYMSGEGAEKYFEKTNQAGENECRRAPTAYAHEVVAEGRAGPLERLAFFACSGAETDDLDPDDQYPNEPIDDGTPDSGDSQVTQLEARHRRGGDRIVIVSIGGNDAEFSTIGMACLAPGSCVERGQVWLDRLGGVAEDVEASYRKIRRAVDDAVPIVAVPYPQPIRETSCPSSLLEDDEHRFLHGFVKQLNGRIRQAARDARIYFLDGMRGAFGEGLRICDGRTEDMGVNFIALRSVRGFVEQALHPANWIHNSLHPNEDGHDAMAIVLEDWLREHAAPPVRPRGDDVPEPFAPASLEGVMQEPVPHCRGTPEPDHCDRDDDQWAITQVARFLAGALLPALVLVAGCWLFWLPVLARTRYYWEERGDGDGATS
jgi:lysophospholipase L1-like esterase